MSVLQLSTDQRMTAQRSEDAAFAATGQRFGVSYRQGYRAGWREGIEWMQRTLAGWDQLPADDAISELRKGDRSVYWPLFKDDPRVWVDCPDDGRVVVGAEGLCDRCGREFASTP